MRAAAWAAAAASWAAPCSKGKRDFLRWPAPGVVEPESSRLPLRPSRSATSLGGVWRRGERESARSLPMPGVVVAVVGPRQEPMSSAQSMWPLCRADSSGVSPSDVRIILYNGDVDKGRQYTQVANLTALGAESTSCWLSKEDIGPPPQNTICIRNAHQHCRPQRKTEHTQQNRTLHQESYDYGKTHKTIETNHPLSYLFAPCSRRALTTSRCPW